MFSAATIALLFLSPILGETGADDVPFADSLGRSAIQQERLDDVLEHGLIIGNGDINALVYSQGNRVQISLTKNDVWDARLLTENDPPLPTMKRLKELAARGWPRNGNGEWILWRGITIALATNDTFGFHLAISAISLVAIQAIVNMSVSMSLFPTTGVTLPFFSYGGSSLMTVFIASGLVLSVSRGARV